jgi:hypothetical protein
MSELKIQQKWEDMCKYAYIALRHIPRSERFTLGQEIRSGLWRGLRLILRANAIRNKRQVLYELDWQIKELLAMIRTAHALEILPTKKYELWAGKLVELGRMTGGWIKYARV